MDTLEQIQLDIVTRAIEEIGFNPFVDIKDGELFHSYIKGCCRNKPRPTEEQREQYRALVFSIAEDNPDLYEEIIGNFKG